MKTKNLKPLIISSAITVFEFIVFLIWGNVMDPVDAMGFFLITTYFLFPLTTLILSVYLMQKKSFMIIPFLILMFAAQNLMPYLLTSTFEIGLICALTFVPALIGILISYIIKAIKKHK